MGTDGEDGAWLRLAEAAERLGVSVDTLRRRVRAGAVRSRQVPTRHGPAYEVWTTAPEPLEARPLGVVHRGGAQSANPGGAQADALVLLMRDLMADNQRLLERALTAEARLVALAAAGQTAALETSAPATGPPQSAQEGQQGAVARVVALDDQEAPRRPWWAFWRGSRGRLTPGNRVSPPLGHVTDTSQFPVTEW